MSSVVLPKPYADLVLAGRRRRVCSEFCHPLQESAARFHQPVDPLGRVASRLDGEVEVQAQPVLPPRCKEGPAPETVLAGSLELGPYRLLRLQPQIVRRPW